MNHRNGSAYHARFAGELHRKEGGVSLVVTRREEGDGVEMAYHGAEGAPAVAFLGKAEARELRDYLDRAVQIFDAA